MCRGRNDEEDIQKRCDMDSSWRGANYLCSVVHGIQNKRYYYLSMEKCLDEHEDRFDAVLSIPEDRKIKENFDRDVTGT